MPALKGPEVFVPKIHRARKLRFLFSKMDKQSYIALRLKLYITSFFLLSPHAFSKKFSFVDMLKASKVHLEWLVLERSYKFWTLLCLFKQNASLCWPLQYKWRNAIFDFQTKHTRSFRCIRHMHTNRKQECSQVARKWSYFLMHYVHLVTYACMRRHIVKCISWEAHLRLMGWKLDTWGVNESLWVWGV